MSEGGLVRGVVAGGGVGEVKGVEVRREKEVLGDGKSMFGNR